MTDRPEPRFRLRIVFGEGEMIGPGKAELLEHIAETGSIAAAGRRMGMSYKRAWQLVETLNAMFAVPLVERSRGGVKGGGAALTGAGTEVLETWRRLESRAQEAGAEEIATLRGLLRDGKQTD